MRWGLRIIISNALHQMMQQCSQSDTIMLVTHRVLYNYLLDYYLVEGKQTLKLPRVPYCSVTKLMLDPELAKEDANIPHLIKNDKKQPVFCKKYIIEYLCNASHLDSDDENNKI